MHSVTKKLYLDPSTLKLKLPDTSGNSKFCIQTQIKKLELAYSSNNFNLRVEESKYSF